MNEENFVEAFIRGFSKPLILWLICLKPMHGYNLIKEFKNITGRKLKPAVIYPFLHTLEKKGFIVGTWMTRGKRRIKNYSITQKGRGLLISLKDRLKVPIKKIIFELLSIKEKRKEKVTDEMLIQHYT